MSISATIVQKRWKVLREKYSVAYRKFFYEQIPSTWSLYENCSFLEPFVNLKPDNKKEDAAEDQTEAVERVPKSVFDESYLTHLVKERPCLYDKQHEDFRSTNVRKRAWQEIAKVAGWDSKSIQKRWRVMRDRFVRELRRTKNTSDEAQVNCSTFFRDMLFLTQHVKSKKYEAEADLSENSREEWEAEVKNERLETCIIAEDNLSADSLQVLETTENSDQVVGYSMHPNQLYEDGQEAYDDSCDVVDNEENLYEEEHELEPDSNALHQNSDQVVAMEEIPEEQWFKSSTSYDSKKRRVLFDEHDDEPPAKFIRVAATKSPTNSTPKPRSTEATEQADEDTAFGQTIGLMLRKFPKHLKTSVKLKILQSIADFEIQHNLNQS